MNKKSWVYVVKDRNLTKIERLEVCDFEPSDTYLESSKKYYRETFPTSILDFYLFEIENDEEGKSPPKRNLINILDKNPQIIPKYVWLVIIKYGKKNKIVSRIFEKEPGISMRYEINEEFKGKKYTYSVTKIPLESYINHGQ